jgi:hypothetical protein
MSDRPPKTGSEQRSVKPQVRKLLDAYGWKWWQGGASVFGKSGISDTLAIKDGYFLAIESKYGANKATHLQVGYLNDIGLEGGFAVVVNEENLDALDIVLLRLGYYAAARREGQDLDAGTDKVLIQAIQRLQGFGSQRDVQEALSRKATRRFREQQRVVAKRAEYEKAMPKLTPVADTVADQEAMADALAYRDDGEYQPATFNSLEDVVDDHDD